MSSVLETQYLLEIYGRVYTTNGIITAVHGGPRYQVDINGQHSRQVHIDHLQPGNCKDTVTPTDQVMDLPDTDGHDSSLVPSDTIVDSTSIITTTEPLRRSTHLITPTRQLIEEMD